ncbi:MAG: hypothetical protein OXE86_02465 [Alphaproteobacteria bacterium]|nr:hypothetical protein [Alphaproteobacteria bacterium]
MQASQIDVLVRDPASLEVVRKVKHAKTDRIDAQRMVRALRAWNPGRGGGSGSVCGSDPTEEEQDATLLLRNRERS